MERHSAAVARVAAAVRQFFERKEAYRIFHGSTNSTRPRPWSRAAAVDISALDRVVSVDVAARTALVEPNVPMDRLVEQTLRHGLVPPVVMEFPGITAGGGFAGTAGESSSFRHGFFDDTVRSVEMVLADGQVVTARPEGERADLFRGAAGAVGTLGIATLLELRLMRARRYVKTTYRRTGSVAEAVAAVRAATAREGNDYVDGILYSKDHGVIVTGELTDEKPAGVRPQTFSRAWDPWFYLHVQERTRSLPASSSSSSPVSAAAAAPAGAAVEGSSAADPSTVTEYIPLAEYLFRYDRGGFWVGRQPFRYFWMVPFTRLTRWFLDDFLHTRMMYRALHASGQHQTFVVQDLALPFETAERFVDYTADEFAIWPLWLCPLQRRAPPTFHPFATPPPLPASVSSEKVAAPALSGAAEAVSASTAADGTRTTTTTTTITTTTAVAADGTTEEARRQAGMMLNIGLWGPGPAALSRSPAAFVAANRRLEAKLRELGGMKWLYAHTYYSAADFWAIYGGRGWYDALRAKYGASHLPSVYDKVKVDEDVGARARVLPWPFGGFYGIWKAIQSRDYEKHRKAEWKWNGEEEKGH